MPLTAKEQKKVAHERAGDWVCKRCNNHNFSFRSNCNMCHLSHDASVKMHYMMNNSSQPIKEASVPSSATGYNSVSKLPSNNSSSALVPNPFMNQLQSTMRERVVNVNTCNPPCRQPLKLQRLRIPRPRQHRRSLRNHRHSLLYLPDSRCLSGDPPRTTRPQPELNGRCRSECDRKVKI